MQASVGDLSVGLYAWSRNLLPIVVSKSGNPQSRDLVLQLVEKYVNVSGILSTPFRTIAVAIFTIMFCYLLAEFCPHLKHGLFWLTVL